MTEQEMKVKIQVGDCPLYEYLRAQFAIEMEDFIEAVTWIFAAAKKGKRKIGVCSEAGLRRIEAKRERRAIKLIDADTKKVIVPEAMEMYDATDILFIPDHY